MPNAGTPALGWARRNAAGRSRGLGTAYQDSPRLLFSLTGYSSLRSGPARARRNAAGRSRGLGTAYQDSPR
ncbi:MAG: hypothetical protein AAGC70_20250, partial [Pseudomonadota bacterium]